MFKSLTSNPKRQKFLLLMAFFASFIWFRSFSTSVLPPHYLSQGLTIKQMIAGSFFMYLAATLFLLFLKKFKSHIFWYLTFILVLVFIFLVINIIHPWQFYLAFAIGGLTIVLFWVPYNIVHYSTTPKHKTGFSSALLFSGVSLIGLVAPLLAGFLANISYSLVFLFSAIFFLVPTILTKHQPSIAIKHNIKTSLKLIKTTRIFYLFQGIWEILLFSVIPVFSLYFIKTPAKYGLYIAYLSLMSILANLLLGRLSDKLQKRALFLYPVTLLLGISTLFFPLALNSLTGWIIVTGIVQFLAPIFWNLMTSMVADNHQDIEQAFISREFVLSLGRLISVSVILINFLIQPKPTYLFYYLGTSVLIIPLILFYRTKIEKKYNYL